MINYRKWLTYSNNRVYILLDFFQKGARWVIYLISSEFSGQLSSQYCEVTILWTWLGLSPKAQPIVYAGYFPFRAFYLTAMSHANKWLKANQRGQEKAKGTLNIIKIYLQNKIKSTTMNKNIHHTATKYIFVRYDSWIIEWFLLSSTFHLIQNV